MPSRSLSIDEWITCFAARIKTFRQIESRYAALFGVDQPDSNDNQRTRFEMNMAAGTMQTNSDIRHIASYFNVPVDEFRQRIEEEIEKTDDKP